MHCIPAGQDQVHNLRQQGQGLQQGLQQAAALFGGKIEMDVSKNRGKTPKMDGL